MSVSHQAKNCTASSRELVDSDECVECAVLGSVMYGAYVW